MARPAIEPDHLANSVPKVMPVRLRQVVRLIDADIHAPGGDLVQMRLPEMRPLLLDQRDVRFLAAAELVAELSRKLEAAGAAAHDDDPMQTGLLGQHGLCHRCIGHPRLCDRSGLRCRGLFVREHRAHWRALRHPREPTLTKASPVMTTVSFTVHTVLRKTSFFSLNRSRTVTVA